MLKKSACFLVSPIKNMETEKTKRINELLSIISQTNAKGVQFSTSVDLIGTKNAFSFPSFLLSLSTYLSFLITFYLLNISITNIIIK